MRKKATIETGYPLPKRSLALSFGEWVHLPDSIRAIQAGQSFVVDREKDRVRAIQIGVRLNIKLRTEGFENEEGGKQFRIWRDAE